MLGKRVACQSGKPHESRVSKHVQRATGRCPLLVPRFTVSPDPDSESVQSKIIVPVSVRLTGMEVRRLDLCGSGRESCPYNTRFSTALKNSDIAAL